MSQAADQGVLLVSLGTIAHLGMPWNQQSNPSEHVRTSAHCAGSLMLHMVLYPSGVFD